jgi:hypothetical protein
MPWARLPPNLPVIIPERLGTIRRARGISEMVGSDSYCFVAEEGVPGARAIYTRFGGYVPRPNGTASFMAGLRIAHFERVEWLRAAAPSPRRGPRVSRRGGRGRSICISKDDVRVFAKVQVASPCSQLRS